MATTDSYSFSNAGFRVRFGSLAITCEKIDGLGGKLETETAMELGSQEIAARSEGVYKPEEAKITLLLARWNEWLRALPENGYGLVTWTAEVTLYHPRLSNFVITAIGCRIMGVSVPIEAGPGLAKAEVSFVFDEILHNGKSVNVRSGVTALPGGISPTDITGTGGINF